MESNKEHWEKVYINKTPGEFSWTQAIPQISLDFIHSFGLSKTVRIIDIGGGDSRLVDALLDEGFKNITVLDISASALDRARQRLGAKAATVNWLVQDVTTFQPVDSFDVWHDRAAFHFLVTGTEVSSYLYTAGRCIAPGGYAIIGTFAENGPEKCSGLPVQRYSEESLEKQLYSGFRKLRCINEGHITPFQIKQHFLFCSFQKNEQ